MPVVRKDYWGSLASEMTRSTGGRGCFAASPLAERVPLMHLMEERRRLNDKEHLSQAMVLL